MTTLAVKNMPASLRSAALNRDHSDDDEMTLNEALGEWAGWELGDPYWAITILTLADEFRAKLGDR